MTVSPVADDPGENPAALSVGLAHELRNAAFALTATLETAALELGISFDERTLECVQVFERRVDALLRDHAALLAPLVLRAEPVAPGALLDRSCDAVVAGAGQRPEVLDELGSALVLCDASATASALTTLLVAAGALSGPCLVSLRRVGSSASLGLHGAGMGGDPGRWFEPFARTSPLGSRLSFAVARRLILAQGGALASMTSDGAAITVTLPIAG